MHQRRCDSSLSIYRQGSHVACLLLYADDIILTASSTTLLQHLIDSLHREFDMTDLGALNYFIRISVVRHSIGLFLSRQKYALQLLERAHMVNCNPSQTSVDKDSKLGPNGVPVLDPTLYRSIAGGLQLHNLLRELHSLLSTATLVYCDNVRVLHVHSRFQYADIFTKGLPSALFKEFLSSLSVRPPPALTAGAY
ncbi:ribonuclease H-like domain-containing protein [Tanacetum coccineum]